MGVYIKGMKMLEDCFGCPMVSGYEIADEERTMYSTVRCRLTNTRRPVGEAIASDCPLVHVPPHGDLIDRDKLEKDIDKYIGGEESRSRFHHWVQVQRAVIHKSEEAHT